MATGIATAAFLATGAAFFPRAATFVAAVFGTAVVKLGATLAVYDIQKSNVLTRSPTNPNFSIAAGEVSSRGLEIDAFGQLDQNWRISTSFSLINAKVTEDNTIAPGTRLTNIPKVSASLLAIREDAMPGRGGRYGLGTGVVYVGSRSGNATDTYSLPSYATVKLVSYWQIDRRTRVFFDIHNLFDKTYYPASWGNLAVIPGLGRQFVAGLRYRY